MHAGSGGFQFSHPRRFGTRTGFLYGTESGYRFTDSSGNVRVEDVFCGGYSLSIAKPGFVSGVERADWRNALLSPAKRDEFEAEFTQQEELRVIPVQEQVNLTAASSAVRVALLPVSSIDGVVLDENGEPIAGVSVQGIAAKASLTASITFLRRALVPMTAATRW